MNTMPKFLVKDRKGFDDAIQALYDKSGYQQWPYVREYPLDTEYPVLITPFPGQFKLSGSVSSPMIEYKYEISWTSLNEIFNIKFNQDVKEALK